MAPAVGGATAPAAVRTAAVAAVAPSAAARRPRVEELNTANSISRGSTGRPPLRRDVFWTRPTYARIVGRRAVSDTAIIRRFRRYDRYAGLAFWLFVTRDWVEDDAPPEGLPGP